MGFTSQDDLINQITVNGKTDSCIMQKMPNSRSRVFVLPQPLTCAHPFSYVLGVSWKNQ